MPATIFVCSKFARVPAGAKNIDTTSKGGTWSGLSPFIVGPCFLYEGALPATEDMGMNLENIWQYGKLYKTHADKDGNPTDAYWEWARNGWADFQPHRYPMGKGSRPLCSLWNGQRLSYIQARKAIYVPLYAEAVQRTEAFKELKKLYETEKAIYLRDYDGYDRRVLKMSLSDVLNHERKKCGHAFVLEMLLTSDEALKQCEMR